MGKRGPHWDFEALNVVHRLYWEAHLARKPAPTATELANALRKDGLPPRDRRTRRDYPDQLKAMGVLSRDDIPNFPPLYPAYLLIDLPPARAPELDARLATHAGRVRATGSSVKTSRPEGSDQLELFLEPVARITVLEQGFQRALVGTNGTVDQLEELERACREIGPVQTIRGRSERRLPTKGGRGQAA